MARKKDEKIKAKGKCAPQPTYEDHRHFKMFVLDTTPDDKLAERYLKLLIEICEYLEAVAKEEARNLRKCQRKPSRINGRVYTAPLEPSRSFLVRLDGLEGPVYLLFSMYDLYLQSFYVDGVWYRLSDATGALPPTTQLHYGKKMTSKKLVLTRDGIIKLGVGSSYLELPGLVSVFRKSFSKAHLAFFNAAEDVEANTAVLTLPPFFKFFAVVISEGLRYPGCQGWVIYALSEPGAHALLPPKWVYTLISQWRKRSCRMYSKNPPLHLVKSIRVVKRMPTLHQTLDGESFYSKRDRELSDARKAKLISILNVSDNTKLSSCDVPEYILSDNYNYDEDENDEKGNNEDVNEEDGNHEDPDEGHDNDAPAAESLEPQSKFSEGKVPNSSVPSFDRKGLGRDFEPKTSTTQMPRAKLCKERGIYVDEDLEQDAEIKYSAVRKDTDTSEPKSFMNVPSSAHPFDPLIRPGSIDTKDLPDEESSSHIFGGTHLSVTAGTSVLASEYQSNKLLPADANRLDDKRSKDSSGDKDNRNVRPENTLPEGGRPLIFEDPEGASSRSRASEPSSSGQGDKSPDGLTPDSAVPSKLPSAPEYVNSSQIPGNSTSSTSDRVAANSAARAPGLSPSSSMGSLSSDKSSLNPNAKEFKLNPNAKSFTPVTSPVRPPNPPAPDATYYYPNSMPTTPGPGLPVGMGFPQAYGGQPMVYNVQPGSSPQGYMHPSGQQYGQQMMMGQTRPVYYYPPEMQQYRGGRNY